jgi:hypothetical protein
MDEVSGQWREAQRAWERLAAWYQDLRSRASGQLPAGESALQGLADVGVVRRLLDQVEFEAVRTARRDGRSWAEIAVKLGVTRQSAWERWRDVDESVPGRPGEHESQRDIALEKTTEAVAERARRTASEVAHRLRRRSSVVVPNVVGMSWEDADRVLRENGLFGVGSDPDGPPLSAWPDAVVTDQSPESGAKVPPGSAVTVWVERGGGGAGVREPRRPKPDPKAGRKVRDEDEMADEAVG